MVALLSELSDSFKSLGDLRFKKFGVTPEPEVKTKLLEGELLLSDEIQLTYLFRQRMGSATLSFRRYYLDDVRHGSYRFAERGR
jgi:hypothetical protein